MHRVLLDLSALILIRQANLLRRLSGDIKAGRIAVAAYGLNNLKKNPRWRDWVARNEARVSVRPQGNDENELFYLLLTRHGSVTSNPFIDSDDLMAIAIAQIRGFPVVMRDRAAEAVARGLAVQCVNVDQFIAELRGER